MKRGKAMLKKMLFPKLAVVVISVPAAAALLIYTFRYEKDFSPIAYISYFLSAYSLILVCARLTRIPQGRLKTALHRNPYIHRYLTDVSFKTHVSLNLSLALNLFFAAGKALFGIRYHSVWFGTLAAYYMMLAVMRFVLLRHLSRRRRQEIRLEWQRYRLCGIVMLLLNSTLSGVVILMVRKNESFNYAGYLIYVVAMYAFYSVITAVKDVIKYRKYNSPVLSASKSIQLAAALVSVLSLETAMLMQFNDRTDAESFRQLMTGATGAAVCFIILAMAVYMIFQSGKQLKKCSENGGLL